MGRNGLLRLLLVACAATLGSGLATFAAAPSVGYALTNLSFSSASLLGHVNPNDAETVVYAEYGFSIAYGSSTDARLLVGGDSAVYVPFELAGLLYGRDYHARVVASNRFGVTFSQDFAFQTPSPRPSVQTQSPRDETPRSAILGAGVYDQGYPAIAWFEWGLTSRYGARTAPIRVTNFMFIEEPLTGLSPMTPYHYRVVASNEAGISFGWDVRFDTSRCRRRWRK